MQNIQQDTMNCIDDAIAAIQQTKETTHFQGDI